jgi:hypothetical protein
LHIVGLRRDARVPVSNLWCEALQWSPFTKCAWCGTALNSDSVRKPSDEAEPGDVDREEDSD